MNARLNSAKALELLPKNTSHIQSAPLLFFSFCQYFRIYLLCRFLDYSLQMKLIFITRKFKLQEEASKMLWTVNAEDVVMMEHHSSTMPAKVLRRFNAFNAC